MGHFNPHMFLIFFADDDTEEIIFGGTFMRDRRPVRKEQNEKHNCDWRELCRPQVQTTVMLKNINGAAGGAGIGYASSATNSYVRKTSTTTATVLSQA